jgi:hypothetical protein
MVEVAVQDQRKRPNRRMSAACHGMELRLALSEYMAEIREAPENLGSLGQARPTEMVCGQVRGF